MDSCQPEPPRLSLSFQVQTVLSPSRQLISKRFQYRNFIYSKKRKWRMDVSGAPPQSQPKPLIFHPVNEARALRVIEIMNDFRTLQIHISTHLSHARANPPDQQSYYADGYVVLRQCNVEGLESLASDFEPGSLDPPTDISESEMQKATLQRCKLHIKLLLPARC